MRREPWSGRGMWHLELKHGRRGRMASYAILSLGTAAWIGLIWKLAVILLC